VSAPGDYDNGEIGGMIGRETEVLGGNLPQCRFVHHKPHMLPPYVNPGRRGGKAASSKLVSIKERDQLEDQHVDGGMILI
jgi:hypothetical protein